jgi:hypothetical protein
MDISKIIQAGVQKLANQILAKDPKAQIRVEPTAIKGINNNPFARPLADIFITANGGNYNYNVFLNAHGQLETIAIVNQ